MTRKTRKGVPSGEVSHRGMRLLSEQPITRRTLSEPPHPMHSTWMTLRHRQSPSSREEPCIIPPLPVNGNHGTIGRGCDREPPESPAPRRPSASRAHARVPWLVRLQSLHLSC